MITQRALVSGRNALPTAKHPSGEPSSPAGPDLASPDPLGLGPIKLLFVYLIIVSHNDMIPLGSFMLA